ncbi:hypothetical protein ACFE04_002996 [Oxalis oulophora]
MLEMLKSNIDNYALTLHDFNDIACIKYVDVGKLVVLESIEFYAKNVFAKYPNIENGNSSVHLMNEITFAVLCCALKSMDTTHFNECKLDEDVAYSHFDMNVNMKE